MNSERKIATVALVGLAAFTGMAGSVEAAVANVQTKVEALRSAKASDIKGSILNGITKKAVGSYIAQSYTQSFTMNYTQSYTQGPKPIEPAQDSTAA